MSTSSERKAMGETLAAALAVSPPEASEEEAWADLAAKARKSWTAENPYETGNDPVPPVEPEGTECPKCGGSGVHPFGDPQAPDEPCDFCEGVGSIGPEGDER